MACVITVIIPVFEVSYEVDVTMNMLVRELKAELEVLTGLPIGERRFDYHQASGVSASIFIR